MKTLIAATLAPSSGAAIVRAFHSKRVENHERCQMGVAIREVSKP